MGKTYKDKNKWKRKQDKREKSFGDKPNRRDIHREEAYESAKYNSK